MSTIVDNWAREQVGKIWAAIQAIATDYWGPDKTNGRRSEIRETKERVTALEDRFQHYLDVDREATCPVKAELKKRDEQQQVKKTEDRQLTIAQMQTRTAIITGLIAASPGTGLLILQILGLLPHK